MDTVVFQCLECVISQLGVQEGVDVLNAVKRKSHTHNIQVFCDAAVIIKGENGALLQIHLHILYLFHCSTQLLAGIVLHPDPTSQSLIDQISKLLPSNTSWFRRSRGCPQFNHNLIVILSLFSRLRRLSTCGWIRRCGRIGSGIFLGGTAKQSSRHDQCKG